MFPSFAEGGKIKKKLKRSGEGILETFICENRLSFSQRSAAEISQSFTEAVVKRTRALAKNVIYLARVVAWRREVLKRTDRTKAV